MLALGRWFWVVPVVSVGISALLGAHAVSTVLAAPPVAPKSAARRAVRAPAPPRDKDAGAVAERNIFCSDCGSKPTVAEVKTPEESLPRTKLPLVLVATFAGAAGGGEATISDARSGHAGLYAVGDRIPGAGPVRRVSAQTVAFMNEVSLHLERIDLVSTTAAAPVAKPAAAPATKPAPPAGPDGELLAEVDRAVKRVDDRHFQVERSLVNKLLADPMALMRSARVSPAVDNGRPQGFRLAGVRDGSLVTKIGLQNGDVIQSINGLELTSPDNVLDAYTRLRSASNLAITVARGGAPIELQVAIR